MPYVFLLPNLAFFGMFVFVPLVINVWYLGDRRRGAVSVAAALCRRRRNTAICSTAAPISTLDAAARTISGAASHNTLCSPSSR